MLLSNGNWIRLRFSFFFFNFSIAALQEFPKNPADVAIQIAFSNATINASALKSLGQFPGIEH